MNAPAGAAWHERMPAAVPFLVAAVLAIVVGGVVAAAIAHAPGQKLVWMVAYLVLVAGVTQAALGVGQALLSKRPPSARLRMVECAILNAGNAGVIGGSLCASWLLVLAGTVLFAMALAMFLLATRVARRNGWIHAYRALIALIGGSSIVGLVLSLARATG